MGVLQKLFARNVLGDVSGSVVPTGYVGEPVTNTSVATGTGGSAYSLRTTTAFGTLTKVIYKAVNKGSYVVFGKIYAYTTDTAQSQVDLYFSIGGIQVSTTVKLTIPASASGARVASVSDFTYINITADNTEIQVYAQWGAANVNLPQHELLIVRIA